MTSNNLFRRRLIITKEAANLVATWIGRSYCASTECSDA